MTTRKPYPIEKSLAIIGQHYPEEAVRIANALDPENPASAHHQAHAQHVLVHTLRDHVLGFLDTHTDADPVTQVADVISSLIHALNKMGYKKPNEHLMDIVSRASGSPHLIKPVDEEEPDSEATKPAPKSKPKAKSTPKAKTKAPASSEDSEA